MDICSGVALFPISIGVHALTYLFWTWSGHSYPDDIHPS
jgi:hypothetical protein